MKLTMETFKPALYNFRLDELAFYVTYCVFGIVWMDFLFFFLGSVPYIERSCRSLLILLRLI